MSNLGRLTVNVETIGGFICDSFVSHWGFFTQFNRNHKTIINRRIIDTVGRHSLINLATISLQNPSFWNNEATQFPLYKYISIDKVMVSLQNPRF
jgi:hypothetical protein